VNGAAGTRQTVSKDFADLLRRAAALSVATGGAFDVTVGPLVELWRRPGDAPTAAEVAATRAHTGAGQAVLEGDALALAAGARLDFDGIAKGWAVDRCAVRLRAAGLTSALVSLGESSVAAIGHPADESHWTLAVRGSDPESAVGLLALRDEAASISATFGGRGRADGGAVGHIVDPATGRALDRDAVAVVVAGSATDAEAYTKALLLWGARGAERIERLGAHAAVYVTPAGARAGARGRARGAFTRFPAPRLLVAAMEPRP
jgi:FAD:protein FMN transferase